ncbi:unnamed protein product [Meloidogyne enterolobii]|uniref:Uncharacterized protein n=1 Tax=Meloidogyne enterolobii TaxID=390850 RepID=A0ACB1B2Y0_MELEN
MVTFSNISIIRNYYIDLANLLPIFGLWRSASGSRVTFRLIQLPTETHANRYLNFLNYVREQLRHTNMVDF